MRMRELAVLEALNIASTRHSRHDPNEPGRGYQATAAQIAEVLATDERFAEYGLDLSARQIGATLAALHDRGRGTYSKLPEALVERVGSRRWRLSQGGVDGLLL
jgi:hypothetical protein